MKAKILAAIFSFALLSQSTYAINTVKNLVPGNGTEQQINTLTSRTLTKSEAKAIAKAEKQQAKAQKRAAMMQKMMAKNYAKNGVDFKDPVNKWLWFAVFGWGAGIVLSLLASATVTGGFGFFWLLATLAYLFGTVSFVLWLIKKFGNA